MPRAHGRGSARFRLDNGVILLLCAGLFTVICVPLCQGWVYADVDRQFQSIPYYVIYHDALAAGEWGWWGPHYFRGFSLLGIGQPGIFHPWRYAMCRWLPIDVAIAVDMVVILPLTFAGAAWLLRHYRLAWPAALSGAGVWTYSVGFMAAFGHTHVITIFGHAPWVVLAGEYVFERCHRWWALLALGLLCASMCLLGHPQTVWYVGLLLALAMLHRGIQAHWRPSFWRAAAWTTLAVLAGGLIGALQLLPTVALISHNARGHLTAAEHGNFSLHPLLLLQNLSPHFFTELPGDLVYKPDLPPFYLSNPDISSAYWGAGLWALVIGGLGLYWRQLQRLGRLPVVGLLLGAMAVFLLLAMGRYGGLHSLLWHVPGLSMFRAPHRYAPLVATTLALLGALVLDRVWCGPRMRLTAGQWLWLGLVLLPFVVAFVVGGWMGTVHWRGQLLQVSPAWPRAWGVLAAALAMGMLALAARGVAPARWLLACLLIADLGLRGLELVREVEMRTLADVRQFAANWQVHYRPFRMLALTDRPVWDGLPLCRGTEGIQPAEPLDYADRQQIRLAAVKYWQADARHGELLDPLPRVRLVPRLELVPEPLADLAGIDLTQVARMQPGPGITSLDGPPLSAAEQVAVSHDGYDRLAFSVAVAQPRLLVVADQWDRDWHAIVDGTPAAILPLFNGALRGVMVPAGTHQVEMHYQPAALRLAIPLALAGALLLVGSVAATWWLAFRTAERAGNRACGAKR